MSMPTFSAWPPIPSRSAPEADFDAKMYALFQHFAGTHRNEMLAFLAWLQANSTVIGGALEDTALGLTTPAEAQVTRLGFPGANNPITFMDQVVAWFPELHSSGGGETISYSAASAEYFRYGALCFLTGRIEVDTVAGGSGVVLLEGLPFTAANSSARPGSLQIATSYGWASAHPTTGETQQNTTYFYLRRHSTGGHATVPWSEVGPGTGLRFTGIYRV